MVPLSAAAFRYSAGLIRIQAAFRKVIGVLPVTLLPECPVLITMGMAIIAIVNPAIWAILTGRFHSGFPGHLPTAG